jgi:hypothetical protein
MSKQQLITLIVLLHIGLSNSDLVPFSSWNIPKISSFANISLPSLRSQLAALRGAGDAQSDQLPASKLVGRWKKVKEVGQDQAMMQVCKFHHGIGS